MPNNNSQMPTRGYACFIYSAWWYVSRKRFRTAELKNDYTKNIYILQNKIKFLNQKCFVFLEGSYLDEKKISTYILDRHLGNSNIF